MFSLSWNNIEHKLVSGLRQCLTMGGLEGVPEARIMEVRKQSSSNCGQVQKWFDILQYL